MKLTLLALTLIVGYSSVCLGCLGGLGGLGGGCCSGPTGGCGAQPLCSGGGYGYNAPIAGPSLPGPPPPPPPPQLYPSASAGYVQAPGPVVPPSIGQGSYAYARGKRFIFLNRK